MNRISLSVSLAIAQNQTLLGDLEEVPGHSPWAAKRTDGIEFS